MGWASKVAKSKATAGGVYPVPGVYPVLDIKLVKVETTWEDHEVFVVEFDILESEVEERAAGTEMSWVCNLTKHKSAPGNAKRFLQDATGINFDEMSEEEAEKEIDRLCGEDNPLCGTLVRLEAVNKKTKEKKQDFTVCTFTRLPDEAQELRNELREALKLPQF